MASLTCKDLQAQKLTLTEHRSNIETFTNMYINLLNVVNINGNDGNIVCIYIVMYIFNILFSF